MLFNASAIKGYTIAASDGDLGKVVDILFDDAGWQIRWLVVQTGGWFADRKILLPSSALGHADQPSRQFSVRLTSQQVKDSPDVDTALPVSRQMESDLYDHYGWVPYWGGSLFMGTYGYAGGLGGLWSHEQSQAERLEAEVINARRDAYDAHLRSADAVIGYHIHASDGSIGHVADLLVEEGDWAIHYLVVETHNWYEGQRVLISPRSVHDVRWTDKLVNLSVDRNAVRNSPSYDPSMTIDRTYQDAFNTYYRGLPKPVAPLLDDMYTSGA
ncbi:MAG: PRC-barrel domain-containing protein [Devosia sp.]